MIFFFLTFFFVPETKAKTIETIYAEINAGQVWRSQYQSRFSENDTIGSTVGYETLESA